MGDDMEDRNRKLNKCLAMSEMVRNMDGAEVVHGCMAPLGAGEGAMAQGPPSSPMPPLPPLMLSPVAAGFPSPAEQYAEQALDLNRLLVGHPAATFFVRAAGDSMTGAGIHPGDILVVDRSLDATDGRVVIASLDNDFVVKRLRCKGKEAWLEAANPRYPPIPLDGARECRFFGVVTAVIQRFVNI